MPKVIGACYILHNICVAADDILEEDDSHGDDDIQDDMDNAVVDERELSGNRLGGRIAAQLSSPEQLPRFVGEHDYSTSREM